MVNGSVCSLVLALLGTQPLNDLLLYCSQHVCLQNTWKRLARLKEVTRNGYVPSTYELTTHLLDWGFVQQGR